MAKKLKKGFNKISIDQLVKADWNYKKDDSNLMEKLKNNIKRNGVIENLIVREMETGFYEVVNGNHRLDGLMELEWGEQIMVYNLGVISLAQAQRIAVETNETKFDRDDIELSKLLKELSLEFEFDDLSLSLPFGTEELGNLVEMCDFDWENYSNGEELEDDDDEGGSGKNKTKYELKLIFDSEESMTDFLAMVGNTNREHLVKDLFQILKGRK